MGARRDTSPLAGKTVKIKEDAPGLGGSEYRVEDWWQNVYGESWTVSQSPAAFSYAMRTGMDGGVPLDDEVLYGKVGRFGHLVHVSEIEDAQ